MNILIAFDKFKESIDAATACSIAAALLREQFPQASIVEAPLTDGGEGFASILTEQLGGNVRHAEVQGPRGHHRQAAFGIVALDKLSPGAGELLRLPSTGQLGIIEMASASGLASLPLAERDPWQTSTFGTGQLLAAAADTEAQALLLGLGGSATNDLGIGALEALGLQAFDAAGHRVAPLIPASWERIQCFDGQHLRPLPPLRLACDVQNTLTGPRGATRVFGPQKGLKPEDTERFENSLERTALQLLRDLGQPACAIHRPGTGAAGGIGFGLQTAYPQTRFVPGFELVQQWLQLQPRLAQANWLITGEGRFDASSLEGKGPGALLQQARQLQINTLLLSGSLELPPHIHQLFPQTTFAAISPPDMPLPQALRQAPQLLRQALQIHVQQICSR